MVSTGDAFLTRLPRASASQYPPGALDRLTTAPTAR